MLQHGGGAGRGTAVGASVMVSSGRGGREGGREGEDGRGSSLQGGDGERGSNAGGSCWREARGGAAGLCAALVSEEQRSPFRRPSPPPALNSILQFSFPLSSVPPAQVWRADTLEVLMRLPGADECGVGAISFADGLDTGSTRLVVMGLGASHRISVWDWM
jgi:hypothetical protein